MKASKTNSQTVAVVIYDPFRTTPDSIEITGGPRYFRETLQPALVQEAQEFCLAASPNERVVIRYLHKSQHGGLLSFLGAFRKIHREQPAAVIPISDDPRAVLPCWLYRVTSPGSLLLLPIMHLVPSPRKRNGFFFHNVLSYLSQRIAILLALSTGSLLVCINSFTQGQLSSRKTMVSRFAFGKRAQVKLLQPGPPHLDSTTLSHASAVLLSVGRLIAHKGSNDLPRLVAALEAQCPKNWHLIIIGHGAPSTIESLQRQVRLARVEDFVTYRGVVSSLELETAYRTAAVAVLLSHEEGYSYAIHDAVQAGLPVVAWALPELQAVWGTTPGVHLLPFGDFDQMTRKICDIYGCG